MPGDAKGTRALHGQLVMQLQDTMSSVPSSQTATVVGEKDQNKRVDHAEDLSPVDIDMDQGSLREGGRISSGI